MRFLPFLALLLFTASSSLHARPWTQAASGKSIEAELVSFDGTTVTLKMGNGREYKLEAATLSQEDQAFLKEAGSGSAAAEAGGADWPNFRGPKLDGVSSDTGLLKEWPADGPKQLWTYDDAGMGYSGMSLSGGKLFTMGSRGDDLTVVCVNASDGSEVWATKIGRDDQKGYLVGWGHGPRSTPSVSDGHVYALGPKGVLACLSVEDGRKVWDKNLVSDFGGKGGDWGFSESPLVDGDHVIIGPGGKDSPVVALDKKTGKTVWKASGFEVAGGKAEYATTLPVELNGKRQYLRLFADKIVSLDAETGDLIWGADWPGGGSPAVIPTPIVDGNQIYISSGYGVGSALIEIGPDNAVKKVWQSKDMKNKHGGVIKYGDHLYGFSEAGGLVCQSWKTGEMAWNEKGELYGETDSVAIADGMIYCLNEGSGTVSLVEASPDAFKQVGQFTLGNQSSNRNPKGKIWTHPVVIGGKLYLKDQEMVTCYDVKG